MSEGQKLHRSVHIILHLEPYYTKRSLNQDSDTKSSLDHCLFEKETPTGWTAPKLDKENPNQTRAYSSDKCRITFDTNCNWIFRLHYITTLVLARC